MFTEEQLKQLRQVMQEENAPVIKKLDGLEDEIKTVRGDIEVVKTAVNHIETAAEALAEGQKDIRKKVVKRLTNHERRLIEVEEQSHSHKN